MEQASRAYQIAELRYKEGISTQTELLDSRIQLQQAQAARARAARDLQVAKVRIALLPALPIAVPSAGASLQTGAATQPASQPLYQPPVQQAAETNITGELLPGVSGQ